jgi:hypothetical protein
MSCHYLAHLAGTRCCDINIRDFCGKYASRHVGMFCDVHPEANLALARMQEIEGGWKEKTLQNSRENGNRFAYSYTEAHVEYIPCA